eukprot:Awhi_evm1s5603
MHDCVIKSLLPEQSAIFRKQTQKQKKKSIDDSNSCTLEERGSEMNIKDEKTIDIDQNKSKNNSDDKTNSDNNNNLPPTREFLNYYQNYREKTKKENDDDDDADNNNVCEVYQELQDTLKDILLYENEVPISEAKNKINGHPVPIKTKLISENRGKEGIFHDDICETIIATTPVTTATKEDDVKQGGEIEDFVMDDLAKYLEDQLFSLDKDFYKDDGTLNFDPSITCEDDKVSTAPSISSNASTGFSFESDFSFDGRNDENGNNEKRFQQQPQKPLSISKQSSCKSIVSLSHSLKLKFSKSKSDDSIKRFGDETVLAMLTEFEKSKQGFEESRNRDGNNGAPMVTTRHSHHGVLDTSGSGGHVDEPLLEENSKNSSSATRHSLPNTFSLNFDNLPSLPPTPKTAIKSCSHEDQVIAKEENVGVPNETHNLDTVKNNDIPKSNDYDNNNDNYDNNDNINNIDNNNNVNDGNDVDPAIISQSLSSATEPLLAKDNINQCPKKKPTIPLPSLPLPSIPSINNVISPVTTITTATPSNLALPKSNAPESPTGSVALHHSTPKLQYRHSTKTKKYQNKYSSYVKANAIPTGALRTHSNPLTSTSSLSSSSSKDSNGVSFIDESNDRKEGYSTNGESSNNDLSENDQCDSLTSSTKKQRRSTAPDCFSISRCYAVGDGTIRRKSKGDSSNLKLNDLHTNITTTNIGDTPKLAVTRSYSHTTSKGYNNNHNIKDLNSDTNNSASLSLLKSTNELRPNNNASCDTSSSSVWSFNSFLQTAFNSNSHTSVNSFLENNSNAALNNNSSNKRDKTSSLDKIVQSSKKSKSIDSLPMALQSDHPSTQGTTTTKQKDDVTDESIESNRRISNSSNTSATATASSLIPSPSSCSSSIATTTTTTVLVEGYGYSCKDFKYETKEQLFKRRKRKQHASLNNLHDRRSLDSCGIENGFTRRTSSKVSSSSNQALNGGDNDYLSPTQTVPCNYIIDKDFSFLPEDLQDSAEWYSAPSDYSEDNLTETVTRDHLNACASDMSIPRARAVSLNKNRGGMLRSNSLRVSTRRTMRKLSKKGGPTIKMDEVKKR